MPARIRLQRHGKKGMPFYHIVIADGRAPRDGKLIEKIGPQGGIFIGSSSEVHEAVPVKNAEKMYQTVHAYGTYPIDIDRIQARRAELKQKNQLNLRADQD